MLNQPERASFQIPPEKDAPGTDSQTRAVSRNQLRILIVMGIILSGIYFLINIPFAFQSTQWIPKAVLGGIGLGLITHVLALRFHIQGQISTSAYLVLGGVVLVLGTTSVFWQEPIPFQVISFAILLTLLGTAYKPRAWWVWILTLLLVAGGTLGVRQWGWLPQVPAPVIQYFSLIWVSIILWYVASFVWAQNIRTRLLITSIATVVLTGAAISAGAVLIGIRNEQQQALQKLELIATLREVEIDRWQEDLKSELGRAVRQAPEFRFVEEEMQLMLSSLLDTPEGSEEFQESFQQLSTEFEDFLDQSQNFNAIFFMDRDGNILVSSSEALVGRNVSNTEYFEQGTRLPYIGTPVYPSPTAEGVVFVSRPITGDFGRLLGVIGGEANLIQLDNLMHRQEETNLGETGETYLISPEQTMLIGSRFLDTGAQVKSPGIIDSLETQTNTSGLYENYAGVDVVGVYHWLPDYEVLLVAEQTRREAFQGINRTIALNAGIALGSVLIASFASLFIAENIGSPLSELAQVAQKIAGGKLEEHVDIQRRDEIGTLAKTFNSMTMQLRGFIGNLEDMVEERTLALEQRSAYLEASFEVGQTAATQLDQETLIENVVEVIRDRFNLYYVGLFLIDRTRKWAVLQAGTGKAGKQMLANNHKLSVGGSSMIGQCVFQGKSRIALDVGEEAVRFDNPHLPDTRSEAALPLISRGQTFGALTVQSTLPNAFNEDIVTVLQTMADQVAVAIDNARLFEETEKVIAETQRVYGEMSREAWRRMLQMEKGEFGFVSQENALHLSENELRPEMKTAVQTGKVTPNAAQNRVAIPIKIRNQIIGVIDGSKPGNTGTWSPEEIEILERLSEQLGIALDSARLYEETQKRAEQERIVGQITDRMRETLDLESVLRTATDEIYQSLNLAELTIHFSPEGNSQEKENQA